MIPSVCASRDLKRELIRGICGRKGRHPPAPPASHAAEPCGGPRGSTGTCPRADLKADVAELDVKGLQLGPG